jgi:hypothetical protein
MGCGNQRQIAEAETVDNFEGNMEGIIRARCPYSAGEKTTSRMRRYSSNT